MSCCSLAGLFAAVDLLLWGRLQQTQEQLADKTQLTVESISNMERGLYGPKFENLEKIAAVLKVEVKELFDFN